MALVLLSIAEYQCCLGCTFSEGYVSVCATANALQSCVRREWVSVQLLLPQSVHHVDWLRELDPKSSCISQCLFALVLAHALPAYRDSVFSLSASHLNSIDFSLNVLIVQDLFAMHDTEIGL